MTITEEEYKWHDWTVEELKHHHHYEGIREDDGEVTATRCTWCGCFAPIGVPIRHAEDCSPERSV